VEESQGRGEGLLLHARVFALADKYAVPELADLARRKFSSLLFDSTLDAVGFLGSIKEVYKSTPDSNRGLRDIAALYARVNLSKIQTTENNFLFNDIANCAPEFVVDVLRLFAQEPLLDGCSNCGPNQKLYPLQARCIRCKKTCSIAFFDHLQDFN
jgi:hypothetical protein